MTTGRRLTGSLTHGRPWIGHALTLSLVLVFFWQLAVGSVALSLTSDEPPHIAHGYLLLRTGDTWALQEHRHPPLLNVLTAWPLLLQPERPDPTALPGWQEDFVVFVRHLWPALGPVERQAFVTRFPNMLLGILLVALLARWARSASGHRGAWLAAAVMALDPAMVAHSQLNTTDIGVTLFTFAAVYLASRRELGRTTLFGAGMALGAAVAAKGSGVILIPIVLSLLAWQTLSRWAQGEIGVGEACRQAALAGFVVLILAFAAVWATYGFRLEPSALQGLRLPLVVIVLLYGFMALLYLSAFSLSQRRKSRLAEVPKIDLPKIADQSSPLRYAGWIGVASSYTLLGALMFIFPMYAEDVLGYSESFTGLLLFLRGAVTVAGFYLAGKTIFWHHNPLQISISQLLLGASALLLAFAVRPGSYLALFTLFGLIFAMQYATSIFHGVSGALEREQRMAIHEGSLTFGVVLGSAGGGLLYQWVSFRSVLVMIALAVAAAFFVQALSYRTVSKRTKKAAS